MNNNTTAVEREKAVKNTFELNEQYKDCPERISIYEIGGCKYTVHSHFVVNKNLNEVMERLAFEAAMNEENITA
ncbi:MAG: hypothetical protein K2J47_05890 [Ruminococcus sp.]|nr:hypothetical protein [Ruminococcus sp.]